MKSISISYVRCNLKKNLLCLIDYHYHLSVLIYSTFANLKKLINKLKKQQQIICILIKYIIY